MELTPKQEQAFDYMTDSTTKYTGFGGAAGGGKTAFGCYFNLVMHNELVGSKSFIGRDSLKETRESVLFTFRKVSKELGLDKSNWTYNDNHIKFKNGSEIEFLDLSFQPNKDPLYERFGSKEYTWGWIEEAGPVHPLAFDVLKSRVGRWYNVEYGMIGKIFVTFNPRKNWVDTTFYRPFKNDKEVYDTKFIPALAKDNPFLPPEYIDNLRAIKDKSTRERLLHGNFDYDDDPSSLIDYENIMNMWNNTHVDRNGDNYTIGDIARFGSDKAIIVVWKGWIVVEYHIFPLSSITMIQNCINALRAKYQIPATRCLVDEDGVGGGVVDNCKILGFTNGGTPPDKAYFNLKSQCGYLLAENFHRIYFEADVSDKDKEEIEEELGQLKTFDSDKDGKLRILPKAKIKENIGRSPDWLDCFIMRMFFILYDHTPKKKALETALRIFN